MLQKWVCVGTALCIGSCSLLFRRIVEPCEEVAPRCDGEIVVSCVEGFVLREQCSGACEDGLCTQPEPFFIGLEGGKRTIIADDFGLDGRTEILFVNDTFGGSQRTIEAFRLEGRSLSLLSGAIDLASFTGEPTALAVGRFDDDDDPDLALMTQSVGSDLVFFYKLDGDSFLQTTGPINAGAGSGLILAVDTNNDGVDDIATIEFAGANTSIERVAMLPGAEDPTAASQDVLGLVSSETALFTAGDLNDDGFVDFAAAIFGGAGSGSVQILLGVDGEAWESQPPIVTSNAQSIGVVAADFDRDSRLDLAYSNDVDPNVGLLRNEGAALFSSQPDLSAGGGSNDIIAGDLNQDGLVDLIVANDLSFDGIFHSGVTILLGRGDGTFHAPILKFIERDSLSLRLKDVDNDGLDDLLIGGNQGFTILLFAPKAPLR